MNTITLTDEQMKALQEGKSITIEPPKKEPEKFKCRVNGRYYANLDGTIRDKGYGGPSEIENYSLLATKEEAIEFEKLRKHLAIQFEFLKQHAPDWKPDWSGSRTATNHFVYYSFLHNGWRFDTRTCSNTFGVFMPEELAHKFCLMANEGLIEGLEI
jgi:hypothetical protein